MTENEPRIDITRLSRIESEIHGRAVQFSPKSGPDEGGTLVTIVGRHFGVEREHGVTASVTVADVDCAEDYRNDSWCVFIRQTLRGRGKCKFRKQRFYILATSNVAF